MKSLTKFHPVALGIIYGTFLARAGFFMSLPFLGIYLHEVKGFNPVVTGAILAVSFFVSTFASFIGGAMSDRIGRYPIMIFSIFIWGGVFSGFAAAEEVWHFLILNALNGLCRSIFEPTARAMLVDVTPQETRVEVFNIRYFAINLGGAIGQIIGLFIGGAQTMIPFMISAGIYLVYGFLIFIWSRKYPIKVTREKEEKNTFGESLKIISKDRVFRFFLMGNIFVTGGYAHLDTTLSQYLGSDKASVYTILFTTNALAILLLQFPIIKMMKRYSSLTALKAGCLLFSIGILGFGISDSLVLFIVSMILFSVGEILCFIIGDVLISEIAPSNLRGAYFGAAGLQFIGQGAAAWFGGWLLNYFGVGSGAIVFGILALFTIIAYPFFQYGQYLLGNKPSYFKTQQNTN
ncbi:MDR family MFS transporter [Neobacillus sp. NRS-1170]|uniref:MDR family MFS transporter n=1 Tax=Neobacillus sp. NRS-1170 TaxID=3233898 RepID=UPI003D2D4485